MFHLLISLLTSKTLFVGHCYVVYVQHTFILCTLSPYMSFLTCVLVQENISESSDVNICVLVN